MFDALRDRLDVLQTLHERAPLDAAVRMADAIREKVHANRRSAQKRRKVERAWRRLRGDKRKVTIRRTSGVSIIAVAANDRITVTASSQVQFLSRKQDERKDWMSILAESVRAAAGVR